MSVIEDIKLSKGYALGVVGFATVISTFLIEALHFPAEATLLSAAGIAILVLYFGFLIVRSESRQAQALKEHEDMSKEQVRDIQNTLNEVKEITLENQRASLRIEMGNEIRRHPHNHDTILRIAEKYFLPREEGGLAGNWYMSTLFLEWAEKENIRIPAALNRIITKD